MKLFATKRSSVVFFLLTILISFGTYSTGYGQAATINPPLSERTLQIQDAIVAAVPSVNNANDVTAAHLAAITILRCSDKSISALKSGDFNGLTALTELELSHNSISDISVLENLTALAALELSHNSISDISVLENLTSLKWLYLSYNSISDISVLENLTSLKMLWLGGNSISDISVLENLTALRKLTLSGNSISDISVLENLTALDLLWLSINAIKDVSPLEDLTSLTSLTLSGNPISDLEPLRRLKAANPDMFIDIDINNNAPVFTAGSSTTRSVAENTASGTNIGSAVSATDANNDTLTYTLGGTDASSFSIVSTSGQLQTSATLDYETKSSYSVSVSVSDDNGGSDSIPVTISVTNVNEAPSFATTTATRSIAENTAANTNIGAAFAATDVDANTTLAYTLGGTDASSFSIVSTSGQLQTSAALNYESKSSYSVSVSVSDGKGGSDSIAVTINVTDVNEAPVFDADDSTTRAVAENTASGRNIGAVVGATDPDSDTLTYSLRGPDVSLFSIVSTTGQLETDAALDYETKSSYSVTVSVSDGKGGSDSIAVTITVTDVNEAPVFDAGDSITFTITENTASGTAIGIPLSATDPDNNATLIYSLSGPDASSFSIVSTTGQLQTKTALDYKTKNAYTVTVSVSDGKGGSDSIAVTINVTNVHENSTPSFTEGSRTTRAVAENTASGRNIGAVVGATDPDSDTLTYSLRGPDVSSFSIGGTSGQLETYAALDYETKSSYSVTVFVSDGNGGSDSIAVTITVTDVNDAPVFSDGSGTTRTLAENTVANTNIGTPVAATDAETGDTLTYSLSGPDASSFSIVSTSGQLQTYAALDYETKSSYSVTVSVSDGNGGSDSIAVTINVTDVNDAPVFSDSSTTRAVAENTVANTNIGTPVAATDVDTGDTLTYSLSGPDASSFSIVSISGQLQTYAALDYETKDAYTVTVSVSDSNGRSDRITVAITVTDANDAPVFTDGDSTTRSVADNTASDQNIGAVVEATDPDTDTLTYSLSGPDADSFSIVSTSGQLRTKAALNYETKDVYTLTVFVSDGNGGSDSITVTINVTDADGYPLYGRTQQVQNAIVAAVPGVNSANDVTAAHLAAITILNLSNKRITSLKSDDFDGLTTLVILGLYSNNLRSLPSGIFDELTALKTLGLQHNALSSLPSGIFDELTVLTYLRLSNNNISDISELEDLTLLISLSVGGNPISDYEPLRRLQTAIQNAGNSITIDIDMTNNPPVFTDGDSVTRAIAENTAAGINIGAAVSATDADSDDTLTYSLGGTDADSFDILSDSGQLQTKDDLDYETKSSYTITVTVYDGNSGGDRITVTINVTDAVGAAPSAQGTSVIPDKTALLTNYPNPFNPETWIPYQLAKPAEVTLTIYDIRGVVVRELKLGHQAAGMYHSRSRAIHWDGRNNIGEQVATGVYFYTFKAGDFTATRKLLIRK